MRRLLAVLVVLAACGDDGNVNPLADAPPAPDTPADAPTSGVVTLTVTVGVVPQPNVKVYFQEADGSLVLATTTNASGVASATMGIGGFVTAIDPFSEAGAGGVLTNLGVMKTFAGVKPNDNLILRGPARTPPVQTNVTVVAPEDPGASEYFMFTSCGGYFLQPSAGSGEPAGGPIVLQDCGATIDLVIETRDSGGVRGFISANNVAVSEAGMINLSLSAYAAPQSVTWMYSNVPANIETVTSQGFLTTSRGRVVEIQDVVNGGPLVTDVSGGSAINGPHNFAGADNSIQVHVSRFSGSTLTAQHAHVAWGAPTTTFMLAMDAGTLLTDVVLSPQFDIPTRSVTWSVGGTNTRVADLGIVRMVFDRGATQWAWDIVGPSAGSTTIPMPVIPAPDDQINAVAGDAVRVDDFLFAQLLGGYDAIRAGALSFFDDPSVAVAGATGVVFLQEPPPPAPAKRRPRQVPRPALTRR